MKNPPKESFNTCPRCASQVFKRRYDRTHTYDDKKGLAEGLGCLSFLFFPLAIIALPMKLYAALFSTDRRSYAQRQRESYRFACLKCGQEWYPTTWVEQHADFDGN